MSNLVRLVRALGADAELAEEFERDPKGVIARHDLTEEESNALLSGDVDAIRKLTGIDELHKTNSIVSSYEA